VILLDACAFVIDVQGRDYAVGDDARAEGAGRRFGHAAVKDQLHLFGTAQIEVLANHVLKQHASAHRTIQHLRQRQLDLPDRKLIAIPGGAIRRRVGMRQTRQPLAHQRVDFGSR
jgi:hypothetical protein